MFAQPAPACVRPLPTATIRGGVTLDGAQRPTDPERRGWSDYVGGSWGDLEEVFLHPGESVVQVSGKYRLYLRRLLFTTDRGRHFSFGKDTGTSFNAAPLHPRTVLRYLSGRSRGLINALGFHWDTYPRH
ncbi:multidrug ABC transporter ATPase [Platysternon megacephalum]|uniref:Multidrug ABC transporter ATPase n=1 Tax=Platysternon megacephalum TaxID=55544 RepID=A0A4D9DEI8_9SAUR|nr:multidrug ABC transporter ATPase [Platysternon megacephalum]